MSYVADRSALDALAFECHEISASKGWQEEKRTFGDLISLMHSELSEALEEFRKGRKYDEIYFTCTECGREWDEKDAANEWNWGKTPCCEGSFKPEGIPIELMDTVIRIFQFFGTEGINASHAYTTKTIYNKTRSHRHGGKVI